MLCPYTYPPFNFTNGNLDQNEVHWDVIDTSELLSNLLADSSVLEALDSLSEEEDRLSASPDTLEPDKSHCRTCKVCFQPASRHNYYGGQVCLSCRAFFRRAVTNDTYKSFRCHASASCTIDSKSRKSCGWCRYQKCLQAGMNPSWMGSSEVRRLARTCMRKRRYTPVKMQLVRQPNMELTAEETLKIKHLMAHVRSVSFNITCRMMIHDSERVSTMFKVLFGETTVPKDFMKASEKKAASTLKELALGMEEFKLLNLQDGTELIDSNSSLFFVLMHAIYFRKDDFQKHASNFKLYIMERRHEIPAVNNVIDQIQRLEITGRHVGYDYDRFYASPWAPSIDIEERHRYLVERIQKWPRIEDEYTFDEKMLLLLGLIVLFTPSVSICDRRAVERFQGQYSYLLYRYLRSLNREKARSKFANGMSGITLVQEAYKLHSQMLNL